MREQDILEKMYDFLNLTCGISEEALDLIININGWNQETMKDILYAFSTYRDFDQLEEDFYNE